MKPPTTENLGGGDQTGKKPCKIWIFLSVSKFFIVKGLVQKGNQRELVHRFAILSLDPYRL